LLASRHTHVKLGEHWAPGSPPPPPPKKKGKKQNFKGDWWKTWTVTFTLPTALNALPSFLAPPKWPSLGQGAHLFLAHMPSPRMLRKSPLEGGPGGLRTFVTCPTRKTGMRSRLATCSSAVAHSRTWLMLPALPFTSSRYTVWTSRTDRNKAVHVLEVHHLDEQDRQKPSRPQNASQNQTIVKRLSVQ
jgi:hypothetical protein